MNTRQAKLDVYSSRPPSPLPPVLHLGCGRQKHPGAFGVDIVEDSDADLIWNLNDVPWPLPSGVFAKVYMIDVLEHLEDVLSILEEVYRVCCTGADVIVQAPFATSHHLWTDPTHRRGFTSRSFKYFSAEFAANHFRYADVEFAVVHTEYRIHAPKWYDRLLLRLANRHKFTYEKRFMYWYPVENIFFQLRVIK